MTDRDFAVFRFCPLGEDKGCELEGGETGKRYGCLGSGGQLGDRTADDTLADAKDLQARWVRPWCAWVCPAAAIKARNMRDAGTLPDGWQEFVAIMGRRTRKARVPWPRTSVWPGS